MQEHVECSTFCSTNETMYVLYSSERSERLLHLTKAAISRSREVHKIIAAIDV